MPSVHKHHSIACYLFLFVSCTFPFGIKLEFEIQNTWILLVLLINYHISNSILRLVTYIEANIRQTKHANFVENSRSMPEL